MNPRYELRGADDRAMGEPYGREPFAAEPYRTDPYGTDPYGTDPYTADSYGKDSYAVERYAAEPYGGGDSWHAAGPAYGTSPEAGYGADETGSHGSTSWPDALPLIEPPPPLRPARPRLRFPRPRRWRGGAGSPAAHKPPRLETWRDWLDDYRQEVAAVIAVAAAIAVVTMLVLRAVDVPTRPSAGEDLANRGSSIPYTDPSEIAGGFPPAPTGPAALPSFVPPELPAPTGAPGAGPGPAVPGAGPTAEKPGAPRPPRPTGPAPAKPPVVPPPVGSRSAYSTIQAEDYDGQQDTRNEPAEDDGGGELVGFIANGDWLRYRDVDFGSTPASRVRVRCASGVEDGFRGRVEIRLDSRNNAPIGSFTLGNTGDWQAWRTVATRVAPVTGVHTVYITFTADHPIEYANINWFTFTR